MVDRSRPKPYFILATARIDKVARRRDRAFGTTLPKGFVDASARKN
jgi:hypothetical protein